MTRAVFLDRDGVINANVLRDGRWVAPRSVAAFHVFPWAQAAVGELRRQGFKVVVVTNQPDIGGGQLLARTLVAMHREMRSHVDVDDVLVCPHTPAHACGCRKPKPGMLLRAAAAHDIDLAASWMVGDRQSDMDAGVAAGCQTFLVSPFVTLLDAAHHIVNQ